jgi:hypothetical protein
VVERLFSRALFPVVQSHVTGASNLLPVAVLDLLLVALLGLLLWLVLVTVRTARPRGWRSAMGNLVLSLATISAGAYLAFLMLWGLNYRRVPLIEQLRFTPADVTTRAAIALADRSVSELNRHFEPAREGGDTLAGNIDDDLAAAFAVTLETLGTSRPAQPARPKRSILDPYFRAVGVDGMTDPFFLETLVVSTLLPVEQPIVVAHEWAHLAGYANEGEANFIGWLTCMNGAQRHRYSAWLFLYSQLTGSLSRADRQAVEQRLAAGPRSDLRDVAERLRRDRSPAASRAGWLAYDQYLKANRVEAGTASYAEVVSLVLGTEFNTEWRPRMR